MTHTVSRPTLAVLQDRITAQLAVLRNARARYTADPTASNADLVRMGEARLNGLISQWCKEQIHSQADDIADGRWKP